MPNITWEHAVKCCDTYHNVIGLYLSLRNPVARMVAPRRAELKQGRVSAEPLDFCLDVEMRSKKALKPADHTEFMRCLSGEDFMKVPKLTQIILGKTYMTYLLDFEGEYRVLFFKSRQEIIADREEPTHFVEEEEQDVQHSNALSRLEAEDSTLQEEAESLFMEVDEYRKQRIDEAVDD